jgi:hypothetical protein
MIYLDQKDSILSTLIENQFPDFVQENNERFVNFVTSYYQSQELKFKPLDIASNLTEYYNISYFRPNNLVQKTKLNMSSNLSKTAEVITVDSTDGFPEKDGYIKINDEIIFYRTTTKTTFEDCVRGTTALVLDREVTTDIVLTSSKTAEHLDKSEVVNIAYFYANEFFSRIKSELVPLLPEVLVDDIDLGSFISRIRSFYASKGSLNSHRILFRILFNDRRFNIILKRRGFGAKLKINNTRGKVDSSPPPQIVSGGVNYDNRIENGTLVNPPIISIIGSGTGVVSNGIRENTTAVIDVSGINSDGVITSITVSDEGENYRGPISAVVRNRKFLEDQVVYNESRTGSGRVEYYDSFTDELLLYDVVGYFAPNDELFTDDGEKARAFVAKSFTSPVASRNGFQVDGEEQNIEFPRNYTFSPSSASSISPVITKFKYLTGDLEGGFLPQVVTLVQDADRKYKIPGATIGIDTSFSLENNVYQVDISRETDINHIYLQPTTIIIREQSIIIGDTDFIISVDDASRFPLNNGVIFVDGVEIYYKSRTMKQFFGCEYPQIAGIQTENITLDVENEVVSYGRMETLNKWTSGESITKDDLRYNGISLYRALNSGTSGSTAPTHTSGSAYDGTIINSTPVEWKYVVKNRYNYSFYIKNSDSTVIDPSFRILGVPSTLSVEDGGALNFDSTYRFIDNDDKNISTFNQSDSETSDIFTTIFPNPQVNYVDDSRFVNIYYHTTGIQSKYEFGDHVYVASTAIPPWWNDITTQSGNLFDSNKNPSNAAGKLVNFTNQNSVYRINKRSLRPGGANFVGTGRKNKKSVGLDVNGIQINSYRGNTIEYGEISKIVIADGGIYPVPLRLDGTAARYDVWAGGMPRFQITSQSGSVTNRNTGSLLRIAASIKKVNFTTLYEDYQSELTGFTSKPTIELVNDSPSITQKFVLDENDIFGSGVDSLNIDADDVESLNSGDRVLFNYTNNLQSFDNLSNGTYYYVSVVNSTTDPIVIKLHTTKSDALLSKDPITLTLSAGYSSVNFKLVADPLLHPNHRDAVLDISYVNGNIDNIIVLDEGFGYVALPSIYIRGGGKTTEFKIPFGKGTDRYIEAEGPLVSNKNFYKSNYNEIENPNVSTTYDSRPSAILDFGSNVEGVAYVSDGEVSSVSITNIGQNYSVPPIIEVGAGGTEKATLTSVLDITGNSKSGLKEVIIENGGEGYTASPRLTFKSAEKRKAVVSVKLKEWTFNLPSMLSRNGRIDEYGGYVFNTDDVVPSANNEATFKVVDQNLDFAKSLDSKEYYILTFADKLVAYDIHQRNSAIRSTYPNLNSNVNNIVSAEYHSPVVGFSCDGIPIYASNKHYSDPRGNSSLEEVKSRYKLKYSTSQPSTTNRLSVSISSTTYWVSRDGGPDISDYPIGSFIEDYEYSADTTLGSLDKFNGRYAVTPEFPDGKYYYVATTSSYDSVTNSLLTNSTAGNPSSASIPTGFPFVVGDEFASTYDDYNNNKCRTSDRIPKVFERAYEGPQSKSDDLNYSGYEGNDYYPSEDTSRTKSVISQRIPNSQFDKSFTSSYGGYSLSSGSVDSCIIENAGNNYKVGDKLIFDNNLTGGSGASAFVSRVGGKKITNIKILPNTDNKSVEFTTDSSHGLIYGDYVFFEYDKVNESLIGDGYFNETINLSSPSGSESQFVAVTSAGLSGTKLENININAFLIYKIVGDNIELYADLEKQQPLFEISEVESNYIIIDPRKLPDTFFVHSSTITKVFIVQKTRDYSGKYRVARYVSPTKFVINFIESVENYYDERLRYSAKSAGATGPIVDITISNKGSGYRRLPSISSIVKKGTIASDNQIAGDGKAIVQLDSTSIGKLKNFNYSAVSSFTENINVRHKVKTPVTAKVTNNFEIDSVEVLSGGSLYDNVVTLLVNGDSARANLKATVSVGTITKVEVIDGGSNFSEVPIITVSSQEGSGASFKVNIKRKNLLPNAPITTDRVSKKYPVAIEGLVTGFDPLSSTIQINETSGFFIDNDVIKTSNGQIYGNLVSTKRSKVSAGIESKVDLPRKITDTRGNVSDYSQRVTDSNYYQNWSYSIVSSRDTKEWKKTQDINTHPAGFKQFGKKVIERRKKFFSDQVFKSSVIFTAAISSDINLNVKLSPCYQRRLLLQDTSLYSVGNYIYGTISGAIAQVVKVTEYFIYVEIRSKKEFQLREIIVRITQDFAFANFDSTDLSLAFFSGIYQEHDTSFEVAASTTNNNEYYFVPNFDFLSTDEIYLYRISPRYDSTDPTNIINNFDVLDTSTLSTNSNAISFTKDSVSYSVTSSTLEQFIISVAGVVQNPNLLTVSNNTVGLGVNIGFDNTKVCAVRHENLRKLSFTNPQTNNTVFTLNYTPSDHCELLIFYLGVFQTQLVPAQDFTISGNQITFESSVDPSLVFGWYIQNETITCESIDTALLNQNRIQSILHCTSANEKQQFIESNAVKNAQSFYESRNELIDGTVYPASATRVEGFDTRFTYTSPRYSSSYVEVLDKLSFNGSTTTFSIKRDGKNYTPSNGEESLVVYIDNQVLDHDQYSVSGSNITFSTAYASSINCTLIDYVSEFLSNTNNENGTIIDRLGVVQNGTRTKFNLSDRGVPKYVNNVGDIFVIKNDELQYPVSSYTDHKVRTFNGHTVNDNKITFVDAPEASDDINLVFFNRQLSPLSTKNVVLDPFVCFDDSRTTFPITIDGILQSSFVTNNFFVVRNGVLQKPSIDYTITSGNITFSDAPSPDEDGTIFAFYAYDGINQNETLEFANYINGTQTDFALTTNYTNTTVDNDVNVLVLRNGVFQEVGVDYSIQDNNTFPFIRFTTAPQTTEDIFMLNIIGSGDSNLVNITSTLSQTNSTTITATADATTSNKFLVFNNGILQTRLSSAYSVNVPSGSGSQTFTFTFAEDVDISDLYIIAFADQTTLGQEYDVLTVSNTSTLTYDLRFSGSATDALSDANEIMVAIDGVVQKAGFAYTVSPYSVNSVTDRIIFNSTALTSVGAKITIIRIGDDIPGVSNPVEYLDFIDDNYTKVTRTENGVSILPTRYKLVYTAGNGFQSFNPSISDPADLLIIRAGVVQNPTQDYVVGPGYIEFTTNVEETEDIYVLHAHGRDELTITGGSTVSTNQTDYVVSSTISSSDEDKIIIYADGVPRFKRRGDFTVYNNNTIRLTHSDGFAPTQVFVVKYPNVQLIDEFQYCPNGERTIFKLFYNQANLIAANILTDADILAVKNGIVLDPSTEYSISTSRGLITFTDAPAHNDTIMLIRMSENTALTLVDDPGSSNTRRYNFGNSYSESLQRENVVIFSNNKWRFAELGHFTWNNDNTVTLSENHTTGTLFAIKFFGVFNLLDQINTPFNGSITRFNLFDGEENFVPVGTVSDDDTPDPTSLLVVKNGDILEPGHDFDIEPITDNETQIVFTTAPVASDVISVRSVGSFDKLDTKTSSSGTVFELTKSGNVYYPNYDIDRPRKLENQLLVVKDGEVQSPLYDYYIDNEKIRFTSSVSFSRLFIMDFRGTYGDVRVFNRISEVNTGDKIQIPGEEEERTVTAVLSPTILTTASYSGDGPSGFAATATYSSGKVTGFTVSNKGGGYDTPVVIRTKGTGTGAKATALVETIYGNRVEESSIDIQYGGYNIYTNPTVVATQYASVYKLQPLNKSEIRKATKLLQNINNSVETFDVGNGTGLPSNPPTVTVTSSSGSGANFKVYVSGGEIRKIDLLNGGSGYDDRDFTIGITGGGGDGCVLEGVLNSSGTITSVIIQNPGVGYDTNRVFFYKEVSGEVEAEGVEYTYVTENSISSVGFDTTNSDGIYEFGNGTAIVSGGTGVGSTGGFDIGTHLRFGDTSGTRFVTFDPIDSRGVNSVRVYAVRGNDSNGGETPDVVGDEDLRIQYQSTSSGAAPDGNSWVDLGIVIDAVPNGSGTGVLDNYDFNLPTAVQGEHVYFRLIQDDNSGSDYDHYGILSISFLGYPTYTLDGCTRGAVGTARSHTSSDLVYFDSYL